MRHPVAASSSWPPPAVNSPTDTHFRFAEHTLNVFLLFVLLAHLGPCQTHDVVSWSFGRLFAIDKTILINRPKSITNKTLSGPSLKQFEALTFITLKAFDLSNKYMKVTHSKNNWQPLTLSVRRSEMNSTDYVEFISVH